VYSLLLRCRPEDVDLLSGDLWTEGTEGIQELADDNGVLLIASFAGSENREHLLAHFGPFAPKWRQERAIDWVEATKSAWPARQVGERIFLVPHWSTDPTPAGRKRLVHNPALACGTGEHPCTQLALIALEQFVEPGFGVVDVGTGSGILAIAAVRLGARFAFGIDTDEAALQAAKQNFELNELKANLVAGSADCLAVDCADVTIANINATVLLFLVEDLIRITKVDGRLILTGFTEAELNGLRRNFTNSSVLEMDEWRCLIIKTF